MPKKSRAAPCATLGLSGWSGLDVESFGTLVFSAASEIASSRFNCSTKDRSLSPSFSSFTRAKLFDLFGNRHFYTPKCRKK